MSNYNFTLFPTGGPVTAAAFNQRFAEIDSAIKKNNYAATAAPTTGDDSLDGYSVGSRWVDVTNRRIYVAVSVAAGAAVWRETGLSDKVLIGIGGVFSSLSTIGLTIDQRLNSDTILALKSTGSFAHGMTTLADAATYFAASKMSGSAGGARLAGFTSDVIAVRIAARSTNEAAGRTTGAASYIYLDCTLRSGTGIITPNADKNLVIFGRNSAAKFIFDSDGDSHEDGTGWTAYDDFDDVKLLASINALMLQAQDPIKREFWEWAGEHRQILQDMKIVSFNEDGHHFINRSKLSELLVGAVRQMARRIEQLENQANGTSRSAVGAAR